MNRMCVWSVVMACAAPVSAQLVYERATQGPTGGTSGSGIAVDDWFWSGWRFEVTNGPVQTTAMGAHFGGGLGTVFGALVQLSGPNDHPDSFNLTGSDVLGTTLINLTTPSGSQVASAPISHTLQNGWYLALFGQGAFGAPVSFAGLWGQDPSTATPGAQFNITYRQAAASGGEAVFLQGTVARVFVEYTTGGGNPCYANCDASTATPVLNVADFTCFLQRFAAGDTYANCDESTAAPTLNVADFTCFLQSFAAGCP